MCGLPSEGFRPQYDAADEEVLGIVNMLWQARSGGGRSSAGLTGCFEDTAFSSIKGACSALSGLFAADHDDGEAAAVVEIRGFLKGCENIWHEISDGAVVQRRCAESASGVVSGSEVTRMWDRADRGRRRA